MNFIERTRICASCKSGSDNGVYCSARKMDVCGNFGNKKYWKPRKSARTVRPKRPLNKSKAVIIAELDKVDDECMTLALPGDRIRRSLRIIRQQLAALA